MARTTRAVRYEFEGDMSALKKELEKIPETTKAMVDETIKALKKDVEFQGIRKELEALPGVTKASARKMARELTKVPDDAKKGFISLGALIRAELAASVIIEGTRSLVDYALGLQEARVETIRFSDATGIGLDTLGGLELAFQRGGADFTQFRDAAADFGEVMTDMARGGGRAEDAFRLLDVQVRNTDGSMRKTDDVFREVLRKLPLLTNEADRVTVAQQLWSDSGLDAAAVLASLPIDEAIELAAELGITIDEQTRAATEEWTAANTLLRESLIGLRKDTENLIPISTVVFNLAVTFDFWKNVAVGSIDAVIERMQTAGTIFTKVAAGDFGDAIVTLGKLLAPTLGVLTTFDEAATKTAEGVRELTEAQRELAAEDIFVGPEIPDAELAKRLAKDERDLAKAKRETAKASREAQKAEDKRIKAAAKLLREQINAEVDLHAIQIEARDDQNDAADEIQRAFLDRLAGIREVESAIGQTAETEKALAEISARRNRDLTDLRIEREKEVADIMGQIDEEIADARKQLFQDFANATKLIGGTIISSFADLAQAALNNLTQAIAETQALIDEQQGELETLRGESAKQIESLRDRIKEARQEGDKERAESLRATIESVEEETVARERQIEAQIAADEKQKAFQQQLALDVFNQQKMLKKAQATFSAAVLAIEIAVALAATGIGAAGAVPAGVALAGAALAAQLALINSQQPPSFHIGGTVLDNGGGPQAPSNFAPDEVPITALTGEGVLSRRGMRNIGGARGLDGINNGGGVPIQLVVQILLDRRVIQEETMLVTGQQTVAMGMGARSFRKPAYLNQGI